MRLTERNLSGCIWEARSQLSLRTRAAVAEKKPLSGWLRKLPLNTGELLGTCAKDQPQCCAALSGGWPPQPQLLTTLDCNSIKFKSLVAWRSQAVGPEALSNQGFYSYFSPREMPLFLCLPETSKTVQTQRLVRYKVLRRKLGQILLQEEKNESKSVCVVCCANLLSIVSLQGWVQVEMI